MKNIVVFIAFSMVWLTIDFIDVRIKDVPSFKYELPIFVLLVFISFIWANLSYFHSLKSHQRLFAIVSVSAIFAGVFLSLLVYFGISFHLFIGGSI